MEGRTQRKDELLLYWATEDELIKCVISRETASVLLMRIYLIRPLCPLGSLKPQRNRCCSARLSGCAGRWWINRCSKMDERWGCPVVRPGARRCLTVINQWKENEWGSSLAVDESFKPLSSFFFSNVRNVFWGLLLWQNNSFEDVASSSEKFSDGFPELAAMSFEPGGSLCPEMTTLGLRPLCDIMQLNGTETTVWLECLEQPESWGSV